MKTALIKKYKGLFQYVRKSIKPGFSVGWSYNLCCFLTISGKFIMEALPPGKRMLLP